MRIAACTLLYGSVDSIRPVSAAVGHVHDLLSCKAHPAEQWCELSGAILITALHCLRASTQFPLVTAGSC